jgi:hypothetical protein
MDESGTVKEMGKNMGENIDGGTHIKRRRELRYSTFICARSPSCDRIQWGFNVPVLCDPTVRCPLEFDVAVKLYITSKQNEDTSV